MPRVRVEAPVHATESVARVKVACLNVFPDLVFSEGEDRLLGEGSSLERFREIVRSEKIRDTARGVLIHGREGGVFRFALSKQAAYMGRVNFGAGAALGDLAVTVEDSDLDALIDWVAESTIGRRLTGAPDRTGGR